MNPDVTSEELDALTRECETVAPADLESKGLGKSHDVYGMSKALVNLYVAQLGRRFPQMKINCCTPGLIQTDMLINYLARKSQEEREALEKEWRPPSDGARCPVFLMTSTTLQGNGRYYGSDCKRSPLDIYRPSGTPEYAEET